MKYLLQVVTFAIALVATLYEYVKKDNYGARIKVHHLPVPTLLGWIISGLLVLSCAFSLVTTWRDARDDDAKLGQLQELNKTLVKQNLLILEQSKIVQNQLEQTEYSLSLASVEFEHVDMDVTLMGVSNENVAAMLSSEDAQRENDLSETVQSTCQKVLAEDRSTSLGKITTRNLQKSAAQYHGYIVRPWTIPTNDCTDVELEAAHWAKSTRLLSYLDPSHHIGLSMDIFFDGFVFEGSQSLDCDLWMEHQTYPCINFGIRTTKPPLTWAEIDFGPLNFLERTNFTFGLRVPAAAWNKVFRGQMVYGRDLNFRDLRLTACDVIDSQDEIAKEHLRTFRSDLNFVLHLQTFEKANDKFHVTDIVLRKNDKKSASKQRCDEYHFDPVATYR